LQKAEQAPRAAGLLFGGGDGRGRRGLLLVVDRLLGFALVAAIAGNALAQGADCRMACACLLDLAIGQRNAGLSGVDLGIHLLKFVSSPLRVRLSLLGAIEHRLGLAQGSLSSLYLTRARAGLGDRKVGSRCQYGLVRLGELGLEIRVVEAHQRLPKLDRLAFLGQNVCHLPGDLGCNLGFLGLKRTGGSERYCLVGRFRHAGSDLPGQHRSQLPDAAGWKAGATPYPLDLRWCNGEGDEEGSGKQEHGN
jgi:hypothetical protein